MAVRKHCRNRQPNLRIEPLEERHMMAAPQITSFTDTPDPVELGDSIELRARVFDLDFNTFAVNFYEETNGRTGLQVGPGGDDLLGFDSLGFDGYSLSLRRNTPGTATYYALAIDFAGQVSFYAETTNTVVEPNSPPQIDSFSASANSVEQGDPLTLTADGLEDPNGDRDLSVRFYRESNLRPGWQSSDELVGSASTLSGKSLLRLNVDSADLPAGVNTFYARPTDGEDFGRVKTASVTITAPPPPPSHGSLGGRLWNDADSDGQWDGGESALVGWTIFLDDDNDGELDSSERRTTTNATGHYEFKNVERGDYVVAQVLPPGYRQTSFGSSTIQRAVAPASSQSWNYSDPGMDLIGMPEFRSDPRFAGITGRGVTSVIIDSGIQLDHPFFGPDEDRDGVADRIVHHWDYAEEDNDASDTESHGTHVTGTIASGDLNFPGVAPEADIIAFKVGKDGARSLSTSAIENALQWVIDAVAAYNIVSVNMSFGGGNYTEPRNGAYFDELEALSDMDVLLITSAGNSRVNDDDVVKEGVGNNASIPDTITVGAVDANSSSETSASFSQTDSLLLDVYAPGVSVVSANLGGGTVRKTGTSMASPHVAGAATLMQQLAMERLGRRLTTGEFRSLLESTGDTMVDEAGDVHPRLNVHALADAVWSLAGEPQKQYARIHSGEQLTNLDFGVKEASVALPGDFNTDGIVNSADYSVWRNSLGSAVVPFTGADGDGNGTVNQEDYAIWRANFGKTTSSVADHLLLASEANDVAARLARDKAAIDEVLTDCRHSTPEAHLSAMLWRRIGRTEPASATAGGLKHEAKLRSPSLWFDWADYADLGWSSALDGAFSDVA